MRQLSIILLTLIAICCASPTYAAVKGGIDYSIPIDYTKLSESELVSSRYIVLNWEFCMTKSAWIDTRKAISHVQLG